MEVLFPMLFLLINNVFVIINYFLDSLILAISVNRFKAFAYSCLSYMGLAKFYESNGDYMMSLRENQKATALLIPSFIPKSEYSLPDSSHLFYVKRKVDLLSNLTSKVQLLILMDRKKFKG